MFELTQGNIIPADRSIGILKHGETFLGFSDAQSALSFVQNEQRWGGWVDVCVEWCGVVLS